MFLAVNELIKEKSRFILITFVIILVSYLTFFLTSLAYGLATSYTQGIDSWEADGIILREDANGTIARSLLSEKDYKELVGENAALLGVGSATVSKDESEDVALFGIDLDNFLAPEVAEGREVDGEYEVVASDELKTIGYELGDEVTFRGYDSRPFELVGFVSGATFQTQPIIYLDLENWRTVVSETSGMVGMRDNTTVNAVVTKGSSDSSKYDNDTLSWQSIQDFSFGLPGYQAQVLTFSLMIGFLIAIASFVLAIFIYILTIQKKSIFGVLKAEGVPNSYISRSVMAQVAILSAFGLAIGLLLALLTGFFLAGKVPFMVNPLFYVGIVVLFLGCAAIGGLASVRSVTKIDPVEAIE